MNKKTTLIVFLFLLGSLWASAQTKTITGKVSDSAGQPLVGITVLVKGSTTLGTTTAVDGTYELKNAPANAILSFSSIGMKSEESSAQGRNVIDATLTEDALNLEDVVVVGYGTAKLKDLTSPITNVKSEEITKHATSDPMQALQGKVAGVQITNSGIPGEAPHVRIRGVGSFTNENPLYVVDGMFYENISFLNNNDVESIALLKDASAAAIYGVRAANGVVLVTTKKGALNQRATVTYDGYIGFQRATNVMKLANSAEYTMMLKERGEGAFMDPIDLSIQRFGGTGGVPNTDTDWYKELLRTAKMQNHSLDVSGGTDKATYSVGLSYLQQDGIMNAKSDYERFNIRTRGDYQPYKWLKLGANVIISNSTRNSVNHDAWNKAFLVPSLMPVYDENNTAAYPVKYASTQALGLTNNLFMNPVALAEYDYKTREYSQVLPSFYAEIGILGNNKLTFRTNYSQDIRTRRTKDFAAQHIVASNQKNDKSILKKTNDDYKNYILDNTLTYNDSYGKHNLSVMVGQSIRSEKWQMLEGEAKGVPNARPEYIYVSQGEATSRIANDDGSRDRGASFFARATYNYDSKYMLSATMRADGSSKYQEKWGYFPSIGIAWNVTNENFMKSQKVFDYLKIRASWGQLGNDKVSASAGFAGIETGLEYSGVWNDVLSPGYISQNTFSWLKWEVVTETNVGFEAAFLNNRLTADFDYYSRTTNNAVVACPMPITGEKVDGNFGKIKNSGFELSLNWSDKIGKDFSYNVGVNMSTLKNEVISLKDNVPYVFLNGEAITTPGRPINTFYGYNVLGVYQNQAQIDADPVASKYNAENTNGKLVPGDLIYQDLDGNHVIDAKDRDYLGSPLPKFTYGGNIGLAWKNLDFGISFMGVTGNKIFNSKRGLRFYSNSINFDEDLVKNRWHGEGTSNTHPSSESLGKPWTVNNWSSFFVESASYFRIQNMQLGYTFQNIAPKGKQGAKLRIYASAERPFTHFTYNGFTPEIPDGRDTQTYPIASTYTFGIKLTY